jgi:thiosulfate dehydrogenase
MRNFLLGIVITLLVLIGGAFWMAKTGRVGFEADQQSSEFERRLAVGALDAATDRRAPEVKNPVPATEENIVAGAQLYLNHCAGCHGIPANPDSQLGRSFNPPVPQFFKDAPDMPDNQDFYVIDHGIRWTGMPAWNKTLNENQIWQLVTFLSNIERLSPAAKKVLDVNPPPAIESPERR